MDTLLGFLGALATAAAGLGCWHLGDRAARRLGKGAGEGLAALALLATAALVLLVNRAPASIPLEVLLSPAIYLEFAYFLPTALLFFGIAGRRVPTPGTRPLLGFLCLVLGLYAAAHVFLAFEARDLPSLSSAPPAGGAARQTTAWSCGAASAVTLLAAHSVPSTEREMGELCLTYPGRGTTMPRFRRGLSLKVAREGAPLRVRAADHLSMEELEAFPRPCLIGIEFTLFVDHAVVLLGRAADGNWLVADPLHGAVRPMPPDELRRRFTGEAIALVPR